MRSYQLVSAACLVLAARIAGAEVETQRYELPGGEAIVLSVDQQPGPDFCTLTLVPKEGPPTPFWSRKSGEVIEWNDFPGGIRAADKKGDDVAVALGYYGELIFFVQVNLQNKTETVTGVPTTELYHEMGGQIDARMSVTAPNQLSFTNERNGKSRVLLWGKDGKPYLDGVVYSHGKRASETAEHHNSNARAGLPPTTRISPGAEDFTATVPADGSLIGKRNEASGWRQSAWRVGLGLIGVLLIAAGIYTLIKRLRQA